MRRIDSLDDIRTGLAALAAADPRLEPVVALAGDVPLRRRAPGFAGLSQIVVSQQLSNASAQAIWNRLAGHVAPFTPAAFLAADDTGLKGCGLSAPKIRTLRALAEVAAAGAIDFERLADAPPDEAIAALVELPGIGRWTAEIFLLFCAGHPDIFPAGDLALGVAVADALALPERPREKALRAIAEDWSPWRGVAAHLFWAYIRARRAGREARPL